MKAVVVDDLHKSYGSVDAVRGVSFEIAEGEVFAVLGPNGAGKTTIVEILEGFRTRTRGTVSVLGGDPETGGRAMRERIGIVLQSCGIDPYFSVDECVAATGRCYPSPRPVAEVLELVGLSDKAGARVKTLSGGQQRRLDLALALIGDPELVFLDEPTTGFDPSARRASWDLIERPLPAGQDGVAHHALHGRGAAPGRPHRRDLAGSHRCRGHARDDRRARPRGHDHPLLAPCWNVGE
jgi:ABC-2 type transport system ATP-binding protein